MSTEDSSLIVSMLTRMDTNLSALRTEVTQNYVPRPEVEARFAESARDRAQLNERMDESEARRLRDRRFFITTAIGLFAALTAVVPLAQALTH